MPPLDPRGMEEYLPRAADRYSLNQQQQQSRDSPETGFWTDLDEGYYGGGGGASDGTGRGQWTIETVTIDMVGLIEYIFFVILSRRLLRWILWIHTNVRGEYCGFNQLS